MSKYTMTIQEYCQSIAVYLAKEEDPTVDPVDIIENMTESDYYDIVTEYIFPSEWPFYNENADDKTAFIQQWTDEFLYYEIGQSSIAQFRQTLKKWLRVNMGEFAQLYGSQLSSIDDLINNIDVWRTISGDVSKKSGTVKKASATTYGQTITNDDWHKKDGTLTHGRTDANSIVPLAATLSEKEISKQTAGGTDTTADTLHDAGSTTHGGKDSFDNTDTYDTTDKQDLTEHRAGKDNIDIGAAVAKYRELIIDINSLIFSAMRKFGLFMLLF